MLLDGANDFIADASLFLQVFPLWQCEVHSILSVLLARALLCAAACYALAPSL